MNKLRFKFISAAVSLLAPWLLSLAPVAALGTPQLYFTQTIVTAANGSHVALALHINANGTAVDTVNVVAHFPTSQLSFTGLNKSGSYFDTTVPAAPVPKAGKLAFSVSSLGSKAFTDDKLIATLNFTAKTSSGTTLVDLTGSQAATKGKLVSLLPGSATVSFGAQAGTPGSKPDISDITITSVSGSGGTINWLTAVPATSGVDYGTDTHYGLNAGSNKLTLEHHVDLGKSFRRSTTVHFRVSSVDKNGNIERSGDQTFTTAGYTIILKVINQQNQALANAKVSVAGRPAVATDQQGNITITNVASGNQGVVINGGEPQTIAVKSLSGAAGNQPQQFTLTANNNSNFLAYVGIVLIVVALLLLGWLVRRSKARLTTKK